MQILDLVSIKKIITSTDIIPAIEQGFIAYSQGQAVVPPVGELLFNQPPGDVHIKYGYVQGDDYYVIKVASGFYDNPKLNLPSCNGLMLLFDQLTGKLLSILLDEGYLTNLRTAAAGAIAAKYLAPKTIKKIGIIGTGIQARLQLDYLQRITSCKEVIVWGRDKNKLLQYKSEMEQKGFTIYTTKSVKELASACNLIITTTSSFSPILLDEHIQPGTHINAIGADTPHKQEIDENIFKKADIVVTDSLSQCVERGDIAHAVRKQIMDEKQIIELGNILAGHCLGRSSEEQITIADLTGLAVQDIQIAKAVYHYQLVNMPID